jgi:hypothetical protein
MADKFIPTVGQLVTVLYDAYGKKSWQPAKVLEVGNKYCQVHIDGRKRQSKIEIGDIKAREAAKPKEPEAAKPAHATIPKDQKVSEPPPIEVKQPELHESPPTVPPAPSTNPPDISVVTDGVYIRVRDGASTIAMIPEAYHRIAHALADLLRAEKRSQHDEATERLASKSKA